MYRRRRGVSTYIKNERGEYAEEESKELYTEEESKEYTEEAKKNKYAEDHHPSSLPFPVDMKKHIYDIRQIGIEASLQRHRRLK